MGVIFDTPCLHHQRALIKEVGESRSAGEQAECFPGDGAISHERAGESIGTVFIISA